jgi:hypothetical protein
VFFPGGRRYDAVRAADSGVHHEERVPRVRARITRRQRDVRWSHTDRADRPPSTNARFVMVAVDVEALLAVSALPAVLRRAGVAVPDPGAGVGTSGAIAGPYLRNRLQVASARTSRASPSTCRGGLPGAGKPTPSGPSFRAGLDYRCCGSTRTVPSEPSPRIVLPVRHLQRCLPCCHDGRHAPRAGQHGSVCDTADLAAIGNATALAGSTHAAWPSVCRGRRQSQPGCGAVR